MSPVKKVFVSIKNVMLQSRQG